MLYQLRPVPCAKGTQKPKEGCRETLLSGAIRADEGLPTREGGVNILSRMNSQCLSTKQGKEKKTKLVRMCDIFGTLLKYITDTCSVTNDVSDPQLLPFYLIITINLADWFCYCSHFHFRNRHREIRKLVRVYTVIKQQNQAV